MIPAWLDSKPCKGFIEAKPVTDMEGLLGYLLKGTDPKVAKALGIVMSTWQGLVIGKRCGTSENIGRKARQAHALEEDQHRFHYHKATGAEIAANI